MDLAYISQPYDRFFAPAQNSIGLILYYTAFQLARRADIAIYGKYFRDDRIPSDLPFEFRAVPVTADRVLQKAIRIFPRAAEWIGLSDKLDQHAQYRRKLRRMIAQDRPDVVHVMNYWNWCQELKPAGSPHRLVLEMQCEWLSQRERPKVSHQLEFVDAVVAVSDHIATTFRAAFPSYPGIVATVGNGVDVAHFRPAPAPVTTQKRRVLFVGRISPEKGIHTLIDAFGRVADTVRDVELYLAGPYSPLSTDFVTSLSSDPRVLALLKYYDHLGRCTYREDLDKLIVSHGLGDRVHFVGAVAHKDLPCFYHEADVVVNPSLSESFGISVVEGMACGVPVIGTRIGGMCETIANEETGILVEADAPDELAAALIAILQNPVDARAMGRAGRERAVSLYSWEARAERLMDVYSKLLHPGQTSDVPTGDMERNI